MKFRGILLTILLAALLAGCAPGKNTGTTPVNTENTDASKETPAITQSPSPTDPLPLSGLKICIDPGHQAKANNELEAVAPWSDVMKKKVASGTQDASGIPEYVLTLQISMKVKERLTAAGAEVLMVRETHDVDISNLERAQMANEFGAHMTLRIHCNGSENKDIHGIEIYMRDKGDGSDKHKALAAKELQLANALMSRLVEFTGAVNRNVRKSDDYTGINWCEGPCLIIECGYMSNAEEDEKLKSDEYQYKIADGILYFLKNSDLLGYEA